MTKRWCAVFISVLCSIAAFLVLDIADVWAQQPRGDYYGPHHMWNGGWFGMFFGPILMIVFIGIAVAERLTAGACSFPFFGVDQSLFS